MLKFSFSQFRWQNVYVNFRSSYFAFQKKKEKKKNSRKVDNMTVQSRHLICVGNIGDHVIPWRLKDVDHANSLNTHVALCVVWCRAFPFLSQNKEVVMFARLWRLCLATLPCEALVKELLIVICDQRNTFREFERNDVMHFQRWIQRDTVAPTASALKRSRFGVLFECRTYYPVA